MHVKLNVKSFMIFPSEYKNIFIGINEWILSSFRTETFFTEF